LINIGDLKALILSYFQYLRANGGALENIAKMSLDRVGDS
jgi:hypothetical protein